MSGYATGINSEPQSLIVKENETSYNESLDPTKDSDYFSLKRVENKGFDDQNSENSL